MSFNENFLPKKRLTHLPPLINSHTAHKSLKKSVAVLTAFHGYDQSTGKFNQEPHYFKKFEFPAKKSCAFLPFVQKMCYKRTRGLRVFSKLFV